MLIPVAFFAAFLALRRMIPGNGTAKDDCVGTFFCARVRLFALEYVGEPTHPHQPFFICVQGKIAQRRSCIRVAFVHTLRYITVTFWNS